MRFLTFDSRTFHLNAEGIPLRGMGGSSLFWVYAAHQKNKTTTTFLGRSPKRPTQRFGVSIEVRLTEMLLEHGLFPEHGGMALGGSGPGLPTALEVGGVAFGFPFWNLE